MSRLAIRLKLDSFEDFPDLLKGWGTPGQVLLKIQHALGAIFPNLETDVWCEPAKMEFFLAIEHGLPTAAEIAAPIRKEMEQDAKPTARD